MYVEKHLKADRKQHRNCAKEDCGCLGGEDNRGGTKRHSQKGGRGGMRHHRQQTLTSVSHDRSDVIDGDDDDAPGTMRSWRRRRRRPGRAPSVETTSVLASSAAGPLIEGVLGDTVLVVPGDAALVVPGDAALAVPGDAALVVPGDVTLAVPGVKAFGESFKFDDCLSTFCFGVGTVMSVDALPADVLPASTSADTALLTSIGASLGIV